MMLLLAICHIEFMVQKTIIILCQENPEKISHGSQIRGKNMTASRTIQVRYGGLRLLSGVVVKITSYGGRIQSPSQHP
jgi:hypothetical protein